MIAVQFRIALAVILFQLCSAGTSPEWIRVKQNSMRAIVQKANFKYQQTPTAKAVMPIFEPIKQAGPKRIDNSITPIIEMYARTRDSGPFIRYEDRVADEVELALIEDITAGGIQAELSKAELDELVTDQIFPTGLHIDPIVLTKVKSNLPNFKKIKRRDLQFGYRIPLTDEIIVTPVDFVPRSVHTTPRSLANQNPLYLSRDDDSHLQIRGFDDVSIDMSLHSIEPFHKLLHKLHTHMAESSSTECIICSDGSATVSGKGSLCHEASGAIFAAPVVAGHILLDKAVGLCITDVASLAITPFDAELTAGLAAVSVAKGLSKLHGAGLLVTIVTDSKSLRKALINGPSKISLASYMKLGEGAAAAKAAGDSSTSSVAISDSTGKTSDNIHIHNNVDDVEVTDVEFEVEAVSTVLKKRSKGRMVDNNNSNGRYVDLNRKLLWGLAMEASAGVRDNGGTITFDWINGHPERREEDVSRWTDVEKAIWAADRLAAPLNPAAGKQKWPTDPAVLSQLPVLHCEDHSSTNSNKNSIGSIGIGKNSKKNTATASSSTSGSNSKNTNSDTLVSSVTPLQLLRFAISQ